MYFYLYEFLRIQDTNISIMMCYLNTKHYLKLEKITRGFLIRDPRFKATNRETLIFVSKKVTSNFKILVQDIKILIL